MHMRRKFKGRKKIKINKLFKWIIIVLVIFSLYKLFNLKFHLSINNKIINYILNDNRYAYNHDNIYENILFQSTTSKINNPVRLLPLKFTYKETKKENNDITDKEHIKEDIEVVNTNKPLIYLYNSHQKESYDMEYMEDYNVNPTVLMVSYMMKEKFDKMGLYTIVEENDITKYLNENNMKYYQSYEASRHYLLDVMKKYDSIILYIDVHRDSIDYKYSTVNIDDKNCVKIMFVVGKEHDNYLKNLENANKLNDMIKEKYPSLTRGVLEKEGKNANGIYNQDLSPNIMLIEMGGNYNNIEEVLNTVDLITPIIGEYVNEKR